MYTCGIDGAHAPPKQLQSSGVATWDVAAVAFGVAFGKG